jgi:hypothetical protein
LLVRDSAHLPCFSCSRFSSSCQQACSVGCLLETWTGGSCFFPQLPYSSQEGHLRETRYPWPWLFRAPTGDNLVTNGSARIARSTSSICTSVVSSVSLRVSSLPSISLLFKIRTFRTSLRTSGRQASGEEEGGKKKWNALRALFRTINVIQHKKSVTAWHPSCRTISSRNSRKVDIVSLSPWVGVIVSVRVSGCVCLGPSSVSIEFKIQEQKRVWELCLDFVCIEVVFSGPAIVSVLLPLMFLKTKNKKMTDDAQKVCSAGVPWPGHNFFLKVWPVTDVMWRR